ncbi:MAG: hypothetical protein N2035_09875 [Chthoniobacterales bacterium]|nr:hypothetical protein [Chthoniobacterales bacterium]
MITYLYETIPTKAGEEPERFEYRQSIHDEPLKVHPETGVPVRRVITGGLGLIKTSREKADGGPSEPCGSECCCFRG